MSKPSITSPTSSLTNKRLHLAPMEGVVDWIVREQLTNLGGIDHCVTEFIRVTDHLLPDFLLLRYCPELNWGGKTKAGVPVFAQLLGSDPKALAMNALRCVELGALGIDLNFGCPAKLVNRNEGGAALLKSPQTLERIVSEVRKALPANTPVTAKIRLGFDDPSACFENSKAIEQGGASWLTVHCRTKTDMYRPPAYWEWIPKIKSHVKLPIVANGEVWNIEDHQRCSEITECTDIMIGRGALADPFIFQKIKGLPIKLYETSDQIDFLQRFFNTCETEVSPYFAQARSKMWLKNFAGRNPEIKPLFDQLKVITQPELFKNNLFNSPSLN